MSAEENESASVIIIYCKFMRLISFYQIFVCALNEWRYHISHPLLQSYCTYRLLATIFQTNIYHFTPKYNLKRIRIIKNWSYSAFLPSFTLFSHSVRYPLICRLRWFDEFARTLLIYKSICFLYKNKLISFGF